ncbi:MAG: hypothetical protein M1144_00280 [Candidatus Thermoplasmatota archaeon]|nr:hypothetical protein [Candidatus Thermoplasmatota archaeon]
MRSWGACSDRSRVIVPSSTYGSTPEADSFYIVRKVFKEENPWMAREVFAGAPYVGWELPGKLGTGIELYGRWKDLLP